ncbi:DCC1-like thiol-disulfide oxidoreductase family protein [Verrucomicrobiales bacterium]|nr:DCC1-like thiol-disulfide oxidoreductase family protein [Verrucomicrobiales bacterium]MDC0276528.1 DCC1-like thiol-disulfide oxidoreductase family protein [Verrucomicrobiales bacterium]MDC0322849.1 DCC1-like thiol-disulfide oxidoreductase family protein [Verrucomicrobiales bacterium]
MTETTNKGELFYDATCRFCTDGVGRLRPWLKKRNIVTVPFENGASETEMKLAWHDGRTYGGAEAAIFLARQFWFTAPLALIAMLPGFRQLVHAGYRWIAKNRSCLSGVCEIDLSEPKKRNPAVDWAVLIGLITIATIAGFVFEIPKWIWMWILSGAMWVGLKFMAFRSEGGIKEVNPLFFAWIGTDADAFRWDRPQGETTTRLWDKFAFVAVGLLLAIAVIPRFNDPIIVGWIGVAVMLCLFHFGGFSILAAIWRRCGFPVEPIMNEPWVAKTLGEFWGPRWNRAFSDWARIHVFRPLVRKFGVTKGTFAGFFASAVAHEIAISVPALGGFGLPTLYFFIQAAVLLAQRKYKPLRNRFVTLAAVLIPAPILFHIPFIERVFAPMMKFITFQ